MTDDRADPEEWQRKGATLSEGTLRVHRAQVEVELAGVLGLELCLDADREEVKAVRVLQCLAREVGLWLREVLVEVGQRLPLSLQRTSTAPRLHRHMIESLARHEEPRIRAHAAGVIERDAVAQREIAESYREDERFAEAAAADFRAVEAVETELWDPADAVDLPF